MRTAAATTKSTESEAPAGDLGQITYVTIPAPPSTNGLFANPRSKGRRFKTAGYKDWIAEAGRKLKDQRPAPVPGRVILVVNIERQSALSDIDNRAKALLDLLVAHRVISDDRFVTAIAFAWAAKGDGLARVAIVPAHDLSLNMITAADGATGGWFLKALDQEGPANDGD